MTQPAPAIDPINQALNKLLKPGTRTSEFVALVAVYGGALATLLGAFNTHSPRFNAILKIAALVAAAAGQIGYALSRSDVKGALAGLTGTLVSAGVVVPVVSTGKHAAPDAQAGFTNLFAIGVILLIVGIILAVVSAGQLLLLVSGIVVAVIGFALLFGGWGPTRRRF